MKKVLVATDFSTNSKVGLRFAIQLASQQQLLLTFIHSHNFIKPRDWSSTKFNDFVKRESNKLQKKLNQFVLSIYKEMKTKPTEYECIISKGVFPESCILEHSLKHQFDFICIGTRGAGELSKFFGTTASNLLYHSTIPVIVVPKSYRRSVIKNILYASDFSQLTNELQEVTTFADFINSNVEVLHCYKSANELPSKNKLVASAKESIRYPFKVHFELLNRSETLISRIDRLITKTKANLLIMYTDRNKSFLKKIIFTSNTTEYSFKAKIPLLVYKK